MNRRDRVLAGLDVGASIGVELGPLANPIVRRTDGRVLYVDYADTETLRARYRDDPHVDVSQIVDVDAIWGRCTLKEAIGQDLLVDYIIACHVIEHVPDLVTWLEELRSILKPGGEVRLVVPDKRFSFDCLRAETRLSDILSAYLVRARVPQPHEVLDFTLNKTQVDTGAAWRGELKLDELPRDFTFEGAMWLANDALTQGTYHDVHCWVFTPRSFASLFEELAKAGLLRFSCEGFHDTEPGQLEFFVTLRASEDPKHIAETWRRMRQSAREVESPELRAMAARLAASEEKVRELTAQLESTRAALRETERLLAEHQESRSWKVTAPLRRAAGVLRRVRDMAF